MNTAPPPDSDTEINLVSYYHYFTNMWLLGIKMMLKALLGWIMVCLMLGLPVFLLQFIPVLPLPGDQAKEVVTLIAMGIYFAILTPIACYVGGSTVGFCPWISAATYAQPKKNLAPPHS